MVIRRTVDSPIGPERIEEPLEGWTSARARGVVALFVFALAGFLRHVLQQAEGTAGGRATDGTTVAWGAASILGFVLIVPGGPVDLVRRRIAASRFRRHPAEPWLADRRWNPRSETRTPMERLRHLSARWWLLFGALATTAALTLRAPRWDWTVAGLCATTIGAWSVWRAFGVGTMHVAFAKFPFHPGEKVTLWFGGEPGAAHFEHATFTLRHFVEEPGEFLASNHFVRTAFELQTSGPADLAPGADRDVEISFDLPHDAGGTRLSDRFPRWWSLEVSGRTTSGPYTETFLIPIYERSAPGTDVA
jgi:hypothetical protein